jgi:hypothetical protein
MTILASVPVVYLREAKVRANETAALGALNQISAAYEMYRTVASSEKMYPQFFSDGHISDAVTFINSESIWKELIRQSLLPRKYASFRHDTPNLLAPGYIFSIYPVDYGLPSQFSISPYDSYAFALIPIEGSHQPRTLAMLHGQRFGKYFTNARAYKSTGDSADISSARIFTFKDPVPDEE